MQTESSLSSGYVQVGSVAALWRYPVKSMMGEELNSSDITHRGLLGDRQFAVVDRATGKLGGPRTPGNGATFFDFRAAWEDAGFVEDGWVGRSLTIGGNVRLAITGPCRRCVMVTLPQGDLPKDAGILRTAAQHHGVNVGVYASVISGGTIRRGDAVALGEAVPVHTGTIVLPHVSSFTAARLMTWHVSPIGTKETWARLTEPASPGPATRAWTVNVQQHSGSAQPWGEPRRPGR